MAAEDKPREGELHEFVRVLVLGPVLFAILNLLTAIPVIAGVIWAGQFLTHQEQRGELVATRTADTGGRRSQTLCYGTFRPGNEGQDIQVRVVTTLTACAEAQGREVVITPAPGASVRRLIVGDDQSRLDTGFGFTTMAVLDHRVLMLQGWWWMIIVLSAAAYDVASVRFVRRRLRRIAVRRRSTVDRRRPALTPEPSSATAGPPPSPPDLLYFGTERASVATILGSGLRRIDEPGVRLSRDAETAQQAASWAVRPVVFAVDAAAMLQAGFVFHHADGAWDVDHVPARFLDLEPIP